MLVRVPDYYTARKYAETLPDMKKTWLWGGTINGLEEYRWSKAYAPDRLYAIVDESIISYKVGLWWIPKVIINHFNPPKARKRLMNKAKTLLNINV